MIENDSILNSDELGARDSWRLKAVFFTFFVRGLFLCEAMWSSGRLAGYE